MFFFFGRSVFCDGEGKKYKLFLWVHFLRAHDPTKIRKEKTNPRPTTILTRTRAHSTPRYHRHSHASLSLPTPPPSLPSQHKIVKRAFAGWNERCRKTIKRCKEFSHWTSCVAHFVSIFQRMVKSTTENSIFLKAVAVSPERREKINK